VLPDSSAEMMNPESMALVGSFGADFACAADATTGLEPLGDLEDMINQESTRALCGVGFPADDAMERVAEAAKKARNLTREDDTRTARTQGDD